MNTWTQFCPLVTTYLLNLPTSTWTCLTLNVDKIDGFWPPSHLYLSTYSLNVSKLRSTQGEYSHRVVKQLKGTQKLEDNLHTDFMHIVPSVSVIIHAAEPSEQGVGTPTFWQISWPYSSQGGRGRFCSSHLNLYPKKMNVAQSALNFEMSGAQAPLWFRKCTHEFCSLEPVDNRKKIWWLWLYCTVWWRPLTPCYFWPR